MEEVIWNKFEEKKPEEGTYLVCNSRGIMSVDVFVGNHWIGHSNGIAYWTDLPSPPVECMIGAYDVS